ncbi:hypothetical protein BBJ28_00015481 [Nothophytophthora sp. Chile5]|nr:hypothetical protein BBJ28_00015481 [Nothophytophthora sp. Chile5]
MDLIKERKDRQEQNTWSTYNKQEYERALQAIKEVNKSLVAEKLPLTRTRNCRLFPTKTQQKTLRRFMGMCRWTYNQIVAHFRKTNDFNAINLTAHFMTKTTREILGYPGGMGPPPERAHDTPTSMRGIVMRSFHTNVMIALSNIENGNLYNNGFWHVAIPETVQPYSFACRKSCIALDPALSRHNRVELDVNVLEFGRGNKTRLKAIRERRNTDQTKRTFLGCTAKFETVVKDLHYKTCAYLAKHYDVLLLPILRTKNTVKKSNACNHDFNTNIPILNHSKFRQLPQIKCEVKGKSTVVCSEMYTSRTYEQCYRLHGKLGSNGVFA